MITRPNPRPKTPGAELSPSVEVYVDERIPRGEMVKSLYLANIVFYPDESAREYLDDPGDGFQYPIGVSRIGDSQAAFVIFICRLVKYAILCSTNEDPPQHPPKLTELLARKIEEGFRRQKWFSRPFRGLHNGYFQHSAKGGQPTFFLREEPHPRFPSLRLLTLSRFFQTTRLS